MPLLPKRTLMVFSIHIALHSSAPLFAVYCRFSRPHSYSALFFSNEFLFNVVRVCIMSRCVFCVCVSICASRSMCISLCVHLYVSVSVHGCAIVSDRVCEC